MISLIQNLDQLLASTSIWIFFFFALIGIGTTSILIKKMLFILYHLIIAKKWPRTSQEIKEEMLNQEISRLTSELDKVISERDAIKNEFTSTTTKLLNRIT